MGMSKAQLALAIVIAIAVVIGAGLTIAFVPNWSGDDSVEPTVAPTTEPVTQTVPETPKKWLDDDHCPVHDPETCTDNKRVLIISLDGFRMEYLQWYLEKTPNLEKLQACGVHLPYQRSSFPTVTLANHYTMATGLFPESHGIVDNHFVDTEFMEEYGSDQSDGKWYSGDPIWNTVQKSNKTSAVLYWFPSQAPINGQQANNWFEYSQDFPFEERVTRLLNWVDGKEADDSEVDLQYV